jgi:hypothetical protein
VLCSFCFMLLSNYHWQLQEGVVYAVEFSPRSGRDLINMAKKRTNVIREPINNTYLVKAKLNFVTTKLSWKMPVCPTDTASSSQQ